MIRVLTVSRQFGSGGATIARLVAERLKWRLLDREIVDEVVRMAGAPRDTVERCDERLDPLFHKLLKSLWQGGFETSTGPVMEPGLFDSSDMTRCARVVIEQAAAQGRCVIVGRGAQCLLSHRDDTFNVFVWAPRAQRVRRIRERLPAERDPEGLMERIDRARSAFIQREFDANWCDFRLYDLVLNSAIGDPIAADCIVAAIIGVSRANA